MEASSKNAGIRTLRVCLFGAGLDTGNMGCSALAASLIGLFHEAAPEAEIRLLYGHNRGGTRRITLSEDIAVDVEVVNCRMSPRSRLREHRLWILLAALLHWLVPLPCLRSRLEAYTPWLRHLREADLVADICGGDSFSDIYGVWLFLLPSSDNLVAFLLGKRVLLLPQTYGPFRSRICRAVARRIMRRAPLILARDRKSVEVAKDLFGDKSAEGRVRLCPDVAFSLPAIEPERIQVTPPFGPTEGARLVGVNISGLLYMGGYTRDNMFGLQCDYPQFCRRLIERLAAMPDTTVLLIPHIFDSTTESDQEACLKVWKFLRESKANNVHLLEGSYNQSEIKSVIGRCEFLFASRMHACIAALSQRVPCVGLGYSRKFAGVFETVGVTELALDMRVLSTEELLDACLRLFEQRRDIARTLGTTIPEVKAKLRVVFSDAVFGDNKRFSSGSPGNGAEINC